MSTTEPVLAVRTMGGCPFNFFNFDGCLDVIDIGTTKKGAHRDFQVLDNPPFLTAVKDAGGIQQQTEEGIKLSSTRQDHAGAFAKECSLNVTHFEIESNKYKVTR